MSLGEAVAAGSRFVDPPRVAPREPVFRWLVAARLPGRAGGVAARPASIALARGPAVPTTAAHPMRTAALRDQRYVRVSCLGARAATTDLGSGRGAACGPARTRFRVPGAGWRSPKATSANTRSPVGMKTNPYGRSEGGEPLIGTYAFTSPSRFVPSFPSPEQRSRTEIWMPSRSRRRRSCSATIRGGALFL